MEDPSVSLARAVAAITAPAAPVDKSLSLQEDRPGIVVARVRSPADAESVCAEFMHVGECDEDGIAIEPPRKVRPPL